MLPPTATWLIHAYSSVLMTKQLRATYTKYSILSSKWAICGPVSKAWSSRRFRTNISQFAGKTWKSLPRGCMGLQPRIAVCVTAGMVNIIVQIIFKPLLCTTMLCSLWLWLHATGHSWSIISSRSLKSLSQKTAVHLELRKTMKTRRKGVSTLSMSSLYFAGSNPTFWYASFTGER